MGDVDPTARVSHVVGWEGLKATIDGCNVCPGRRTRHTRVATGREPFQSPRHADRVHVVALRGLRMRSSWAVATEQELAGQRVDGDCERSDAVRSEIYDLLGIDNRIELLSPTRIDVRENRVLLQRRVAIAHRKQALSEVVISPSKVRLQTD